MNVEDLAAGGTLIFHDDPHGRRLGFRVRPHVLQFRGFALGMRKNQNTCHSFDILKSEGFLLLELAPSFLPAG